MAELPKGLVGEAALNTPILACICATLSLKYYRRRL